MKKNQHFDTMKWKAMVLWNNKLWYYTENYGSFIYYGKIYGTMGKNIVL